MRVQLTTRANAFVESFNGTFRAECLNAHWFWTLAEAKQLIEGWRQVGWAWRASTPELMPFRRMLP
jgi:hypothetical protein